MLIMMSIEGRGPPTLIWWHESNFMYLITVKIGYTVDGVWFDPRDLLNLLLLCFSFLPSHSLIHIYFLRAHCRPNILLRSFLNFAFVFLSNLFSPSCLSTGFNNSLPNEGQNEVAKQLKILKSQFREVK